MDQKFTIIQRNTTNGTSQRCRLPTYFWAATALLLLGYMVRLATVGEAKDKYDFINRHEIRDFVDCRDSGSYWRLLFSKRQRGGIECFMDCSACVHDCFHGTYCCPHTPEPA